jgi:hypothetical protein
MENMNENTNLEKKEKPPVAHLGPEEKQMVEMSLRTLPSALRTRTVANMLGTILRAPEMALRFRANPRSFFKECGVDIPPDLTIEIHQNSANTVHLVLPSPELLPLRVKHKHSDKLEITDADLVSGAALAMWVPWSNKKPDFKDPTKKSDADDVRDTGYFSGTDDSGDTKDQGDKRNRSNDKD